MIQFRVKTIVIHSKTHQFLQWQKFNHQKNSIHIPHLLKHIKGYTLKIIIQLDKLNWGRSDVIFMDSMIKTHLYHFHLMLNERDKNDTDWFCWCPWIFFCSIFRPWQEIRHTKRNSLTKISSGYLWYEIILRWVTFSWVLKQQSLKKPKHEINWNL